jgi:hypothetical protein
MALAHAAFTSMALRPVPPDAVFTLSHVHAPVASALAESTFETGARWLLPRCRQRETPNGQKFEHLHKSAAEKSSLEPYAYDEATYGFGPRNVERPSTIPEASPAVEWMWFEEWSDWSGVEKHGQQEHGAIFHGEALIQCFPEHNHPPL